MCSIPNLSGAAWEEQQGGFSQREENPDGALHKPDLAQIRPQLPVVLLHVLRC